MDRNPPFSGMPEPIHGARSITPFSITPGSNGSGGGQLELPFTEDLTFSPDGQYDVGQGWGTRLRPRDVNAARDVNADNNIFAGNMIGAASANISGEITATNVSASYIHVTYGGYFQQVITETIFSSGGTLRAGRISMLEDFNFLNDNTNDIGLPAYARPRNIYVAGTTTVGRDPVANMEVATKQYADSTNKSGLIRLVREPASVFQVSVLLTWGTAGSVALNTNPSVLAPHFDASNNVDGMTTLVRGIYTINYGVVFSANGSGTFRNVSLRKNGIGYGLPGEFGFTTTTDISATSNTYVNASWIDQLQPNDWIGMRLAHDGTNVAATALFQMVFMGT